MKSDSSNLRLEMYYKEILDQSKVNTRNESAFELWFVKEIPTVIVYQDHVHLVWKREKKIQEYIEETSVKMSKKSKEIYRKIEAEIVWNTLAKVDNLF